MWRWAESYVVIGARGQHDDAAPARGVPGLHRRSLVRKRRALGARLEVELGVGTRRVLDLDPTALQLHHRRPVRDRRRTVDRLARVPNERRRHAVVETGKPYGPSVEVQPSHASL